MNFLQKFAGQFSRHCYLVTVFFLSILFFSLYHTASAATYIDTDIDIDTLWDASGSPYIIGSDVYVLPGKTLTIDPGVVVKFEYGSSLNIGGALQAKGTADVPIYFTSNFDDTLGGSTDDIVYCYDNLDANGVLDGTQTCDTYDLADPLPGDWGGIFFNSTSPSTLENIFLKYGDDTLVIYNTNVNLKNLDLSESISGMNIFANSNVQFQGGSLNALDENAILLYNNSTMNMKDVRISNIADSPMTIFNHSTFSAENLTIKDLPDFASPFTDVITFFNGSILTIKDSNFLYCPGEACITFFNGSGYENDPVNLNIDNTSFPGGTGSAFLTFGEGNSVTDIKNSSIKNFANYGVENYTNFYVNAANNFWGDASGPHESTLNSTGLGQAIYGNVNFVPWLTSWPPVLASLIPDIYFAKITNAPGGIGQMYSDPNTDSTVIKTFPNDWILKVFYTTLNQGGWIKVEDETDGSQGWMQGGITLFPYDKSKQAVYENNANDNLSGAGKLAGRRDALIQAVYKYYDDANTTPSLYSSDDIAKISSLKSSGIPRELILAIISGESGGGPKSGFNNEIVTYDYGHGIMQVTTDAYKHENPNPKYYGSDKNSDDPLGKHSRNTIKLCRELGSDQYKKCYENTGSYNTLAKSYANYDHNPANPKYKQYANTTQSIYANIKDGLGILKQKLDSAVKNTYKSKVPCVDGKYNFEGYAFSCTDIVKVKTVWYYNGLSYTSNYLKWISEHLKALDTYFPDIIYSNVDHLVEKLAVANRHRKEIQVHSPVELTILDSAGNIVGNVNGESVSDLPNTAYDPETESAVIFFPESTYKYQVVGDSAGGIYGLDVNSYDNSETPVSFSAVDLPIASGEIHTYQINETKLASGASDAVSVSIDKNGDGISEQTFITGPSLTNNLPTPIITSDKLASEYILGDKIDLKNILSNPATNLKDLTFTAFLDMKPIAINKNQVTLPFVGNHILTISARDKYGNSASITKSLHVSYIFNGFKYPFVKGIAKAKSSQNTIIRFSLAAKNCIMISVTHPTFSLTRSGDGVKIKLDPTTADEDPSCDADDNCFKGNHNRYVYIVKKNTLTAGDYEVQIGLDDGNTYRATLKITN